MLSNDDIKTLYDIISKNYADASKVVLTFEPSLPNGFRVAKYMLEHPRPYRKTVRLRKNNAETEL